MDQCFKDWADVVSKSGAAIGIVIAALSYRSQTKTKRGEWLKDLFDKFYKEDNFKEVRRWIESGEIETRIKSKKTVSADDEKFADYLNFFEFIATLQSDGQLKRSDMFNLFDYYLKKIKESKKCMEWVNDTDYGFEKLKRLLN